MNRVPFKTDFVGAGVVLDDDDFVLCGFVRPNRSIRVEIIPVRARAQAITIGEAMLRKERGMAGYFTRDEAEGAWRNGTPVESEFGEAGKVLGSTLKMGGAALYYFVAFDDDPEAAVCCAAARLRRLSVEEDASRSQAGIQSRL